MPSPSIDQALLPQQPIEAPKQLPYRSTTESCCQVSIVLIWAAWNIWVPFFAHFNPPASFGRNTTQWGDVASPSGSSHSSWLSQRPMARTHLTQSSNGRKHLLTSCQENPVPPRMGFAAWRLAARGLFRRRIARLSCSWSSVRNSRT